MNRKKKNFYFNSDDLENIIIDTGCKVKNKKERLHRCFFFSMANKNESHLL